MLRQPLGWRKTVTHITPGQLTSLIAAVGITTLMEL